MPTPHESSHALSGYQVDAENAAEMARLTRQAQMLTNLFGCFPSTVDLSEKHAFLDIGCGPGEWVLAMAERFPASRVTGIDISQLMIAYARSCAHLQRRTNAQFHVMDARQPLDFPDASFDLIHARFVTGFLSTTTWPLLLQECFRLLRPGGIICSSEFEDLGVTTSPALTRYNAFLLQAARAAGQCFTSQGSQYGITAVQARLLSEAGFDQIQQQAFVLNYSVGMPAHSWMYENFQTFLKLLQPFLVRSGLTTQEDLDVLYDHTLHEMQENTFCAVAYFQRVWAEKPASLDRSG